MKLWTIRAGLSYLKFFLKNPYITLNPQKTDDWHEHICIPLRLGKSVFLESCPYAKNRKFSAEYEDECDRRRYLSIIDRDEFGNIRVNEVKK